MTNPTNISPAIRTAVSVGSEPLFHFPHRIVTALKWAHPLSSRPSCIPPQPRRPSSAKAAGLRYERALSKALPPSAVHGQWFEFADAASDLSYCQTDYLLHLSSLSIICVIEVKYTLVPGAHSKLLNLYLPVVSTALSLPAVGIVIVKNLDPRYRRGRIHTSLPEAAFAALDTQYPALLQWSGQPLIPQLPPKASLVGQGASP